MLENQAEGYVSVRYQTESKTEAGDQKDSDSYSNFTVSSEFTSKENILTASTDLQIPLSGLSRPRTVRTTNETLSIYVSRSRFIIRLISTLASAGIVSGIASAYAPYFDTKGSGLIYNGRDLWPEYLDMKPSDVMLAVGAVTSFFSGGLLIAGLFPKVGT